MNTIKYLSLIIAACFALSSCGGSDDNDDVVPPAKKGQFFSMTCNMPSNASQKEVALKGLTSAITDQVQAMSTNWLTVTQLPYSSGTPRVLVECAENTNAKDRIMDIVFLASNDTLLFTVRQAAGSSTPPSDGGTDVDNPHDTTSDQPAYSRQ